MRTAEEVLKIAAEIADETLRIAEEKGLTLAEVFHLPQMINNKIAYEMRKQEIPFKR